MTDAAHCLRQLADCRWVQEKDTIPCRLKEPPIAPSGLRQRQHRHFDFPITMPMHLQSRSFSQLMHLPRSRASGGSGLCRVYGADPLPVPRRSGPAEFRRAFGNADRDPKPARRPLPRTRISGVREKRGREGKVAEPPLSHCCLCRRRANQGKLAPNGKRSKQDAQGTARRDAVSR